MDHWGRVEAEQAFGRAARARRRAAFVNRLRRRCSACGRLAVQDERAFVRRGPAATAGPREIPLDAVSATLEPNRASQFDHEFRPAAPTRGRWTRVWLAEQRGAVLPPISVVQVGDTYAVRDGHHRVSVAKARGAATIRAIVAA
jgi:ParB-like nuclease domain